MPAYHSKFKDFDCDTPYGVAMLPLRPDLKEEEDIVDEALLAFRVNIYFQNYDIKSSADRTLVYLTVLIQKCLSILKEINEDEEKARKGLSAFCHEPIPAVTSSEFFMKRAGLISLEAGKAGKGEELSKYFKELRKVLVERLLNILYNPEWVINSPIDCIIFSIFAIHSERLRNGTIKNMVELIIHAKEKVLNSKLVQDIYNIDWQHYYQQAEYYSTIFKEQMKIICKELVKLYNDMIHKLFGVSNSQMNTTT